MNKKYILSVGVILFLTACVPANNPQGARVRPMPNMVPQPQQPLPPPPPAGTPLNQGVPLNQDNAENAFIQAQQQPHPAQYPPAVATATNGPQFPESRPTTQTSNVPQPTTNATATAPNSGGGTYIPPAQTAPAKPVSRPATPEAKPQVSAPPKQQASAPQQSAPKAPSAPTTAPADDRVKSLIAEANRAVQQNNLDKAASSLNQAVKLQPKNASIWYDLSQIRLHQGRFSEAEQMAQKAISNSGSNQTINKRSWKIIEASRAARNDKAGAEQARKNAQ